MRENIHPDYHNITVVMTDGTEFVTRSTYGKPDAKLHLDIDPKVHPAWTGMHRMVDRGSQLAKFNKRFAGIQAKKEDGAAAPAEAVKGGIKLTTTGKEEKKKK